ncbi:hypothetical protein BDF22DRAFT_663010 [Syncephalis plumigaleata]|nr:hypothetical protein BDF22DRAFT_663010 [Syncephalis plumigaleata]
MTRKGKQVEHNVEQQQQQQQQRRHQTKRNGEASSSSPSSSSALNNDTHHQREQDIEIGRPHWRKRPNANRTRRQEIGQETVRIIDELNGVYPSPSGVEGETVTIPSTWLSLADGPNAVIGYNDATKLHPDRSESSEQSSTDTKTPVIQVADVDCLAEALRLQDLGYNPLVLNMSSKTNPGGGFRSGAGAQEENLFRRTNLFKFLEHRKREFYPIPDRGGHYIRKAVVFRDTDQNNYAFLPEPRTMSFVAVPALKRPNLEKNDAGQYTLSAQDREATRDKVRAILNIGLKHGHDAIVLSALGCGAYGNPPSDVAAAFYDVIKREYCPSNVNLINDDMNLEGANDPRRRSRPWLGYRYISFAIFDDKNAFGKHNPDGNLKPFQVQFKQLLGTASTDNN